MTSEEKEERIIKLNDARISIRKLLKEDFIEEETRKYLEDTLSMLNSEVEKLVWGGNN